MQVPIHPQIVHFPIVLTFILPFLVLAFALLIKSNKMSAQSWLIIVGLQMATVATGYIALETGETEEQEVKKVVSKKLIHAHEDAGETFVGSTVLALLVGIAAFFIRREFQFKLQMVVLMIGFISSYLAYRAGILGGELVYRHGAASAYADQPVESLLPTPGINTSESEFPLEENESLKSDENDYGNADEDLSVESEEMKSED